MTFEHPAKWFFVREDPNHRIRSTARRHALEGSDLPTEARLVREAIQNSVDATLERQKTDVFIWNRFISGEDTDSFRSLVGFDHPDSPFARLSALRLKGGNAYELLKASKHGEQTSIPVTVVEDRNTCGLGYDETDHKDRFIELCLSFGQDSTGASATRGGSYGFGKEVYEAASDCNTFFVYSVFKPRPETDQAHARFYGCATFDGHTLPDGIKYTGRALFGIHHMNDRQEIECRPVVDELAHEMATRFGFVRRDKLETGTSIMIVGSHMEMAKIRSSIEDYWWPRIQANQLSVELWQNDEPVQPPQPLLRQDLSPYIRCHSLIEEKVPIADSERCSRFRARHGAQAGTISFTPIEPKDVDQSDESSEDSYLENTVALIRSGPRMVVKYFNPGGVGTGAFAGVFISHRESEEPLHLSEPPSHDAWNPNSTRLQDAYPDDDSRRRTAQKIVASILGRIRSHARRFRRDLDYVPPPQVHKGTRKLEHILANVMSSRGLGARPRPIRARDPFAIRISDRRINSADHSTMEANISVSLREDSELDGVKAVMSVHPSIVIDDNMRRERSERLALNCVTLDGAKVEFSRDYEFHLDLFKDRAAVVEAKSERFDRELYASLDVLLHIPSSIESQISVQEES